MGNGSWGCLCRLMAQRVIRRAKITLDAIWGIADKRQHRPRFARQRLAQQRHSPACYVAARSES